MAATVTVDGQSYLKRSPLGVLGLSIITLGIYWLYWYYQVNVEIRRFQNDDTVRPGVALLAVTVGWLVIVPPFISVYNTSLHVEQMESRYDVAGRISPAINVILLLFISVGTGIYTQEHLNRVWEVASGDAASPLPEPPPPSS